MAQQKRDICILPMYLLCLYHYWKNRFLKPQDLSVRKSIEINSFRLPWKLIAAVCDCRTFMNDDDFSLRSDLEDEILNHNRNVRSSDHHINYQFWNWNHRRNIEYKNPIDFLFCSTYTNFLKCIYLGDFEIKRMPPWGNFLFWQYKYFFSAIRSVHH